MVSNISRAIAFCLLSAALAFPQSTTSIEGSVKDPKEALVPGATVLLISRDNLVNTQSTTDSAGRYRFEHLLPGEYLLRATAPGFEVSPVRTIQINPQGAKEVDLHVRLAAVSTTVTVTADGTAQTTDELSKSISVVDSQSIDQLDKSSIADSLSYVPGLRIQQMGGPGGVVSIKTRGLRNQDTAVLMDGFRLRDASATQGDASALLQDLIVTNVDRVEVLRGTGSSIYGTDATGGVINIITGTTGGDTHGTVRLEGGSMDTFRGRAGVTGSVLHNKLGYSFGISHLNVVSGLDGNLPDRTSSLQGRFDYALSNKTRISGRLFISDSFSLVTSSPMVAGNVPSSGVINAVALSPAELRQFENGTPVENLNLGNATFISDFDNPDSKRSARIYSGALELSTHPTESLGFQANYQGLVTRRQFSDGPAGAGIQPLGGTETYDYDGTIHTLAGRMDWRLGKYQMINAGYEFENENYYGRTLIPSSGNDSTANVTQRNQAVFVQDQLRLFGDRVQVAGSYRAQFFGLDAPAFSPASSAPYSGMKISAPPTAQTWDFSGAYFFRESGTKLRAHVGTGYRAPSLYERFGSYFDTFYGYSAYGNPLLKPERTTATDAGIDQTLWNRRAQISATYFYTRLHDVIVFGDVNPTTDPYGRYYGYANTNGGIARGVETSVSITPTDTLSLMAAYTFTNARETTPLVPGIYQTYEIPDHQFSFLATERLTPRLTLVFGTVLSSNYLAPIYDSTTFASRAFRFDGMRRGQIGGSYRLPVGERKSVRFFANADNIFHQTYYESGYRTPGTTAMSGVQFEF